MILGLAEATEAYQAYLEGHRAHPDDDLLYHEMLQARRAMELAWLQQSVSPVGNT